MENFRFAYPYVLYFLLLIPLFIILYIISQSSRKRALKKFGDLNIISTLFPLASPFRSTIKFLLFAACFLSLIIALARPQFGTKLQNVKVKGVEIMIALDVSNSMLAQDIKPNRLERAKLAISKLLGRLQNDKIGLIIFAGKAYMQLPLTTDYGAAKLFLSTIGVNNVPQQGTAIGSAIKLGAASFKINSTADKAIIVITDGENHEGKATNEAQNAKEKGITTHTIGMGLTKGAPIPDGVNSTKYKKDREGNIILSKLNENMLNEIAKAGKGKYIQANNTTIGLNRLMDEIDKMNKTEIEAKVYAAYSEKFQLFLILALIFLLIDFLILEKKNKYLMKFNIFKPNE